MTEKTPTAQLLAHANSLLELLGRPPSFKPTTFKTRALLENRITQLESEVNAATTPETIAQRDADNAVADMIDDRTMVDGTPIVPVEEECVPTVAPPVVVPHERSVLTYPTRDEAQRLGEARFKGDADAKFKAVRDEQGNFYWTTNLEVKDAPKKKKVASITRGPSPVRPVPLDEKTQRLRMARLAKERGASEEDVQRIANGSVLVDAKGNIIETPAPVVEPASNTPMRDTVTKPAKQTKQQERLAKAAADGRAERKQKRDAAATFTLSELAKELGMDSKVARAKMRRHKSQDMRLEGKWEFKEADRAKVTTILQNKK